MWWVLISAVFSGLIILGSPITLTNVVGTISSVVTTPNDSFEWIIQPNVRLDSVMFVFNSIAISTAQLTIYDQSIESPLFSCAACGQLLPSVFSSKTGSVYIKLQGVAGTSFTSSSFILQYVGQVSQGEPVRPEYVNYRLNLFMGYGQLKPALVGGQILPKAANISWAIRVNAPTITFSINKLLLQATSQATVTIFDGSTARQPILFSATAASNHLPDYWLTTSSYLALIVLSNPGNDDVTMQLHIDYFADMELYRCGSLAVPENLIANSMRISDGSKSTNNLRRGASCEWLITPIQKGPIDLLFRWVSLKPGAKVIVYDSPDTTGYALWNSLGTYTVVPPPIISTGNSLYVTYTSNTLLATSYLGFQGDYSTGYPLTPGVGTGQEFYAMSSALGIRLPDRTSTLTQPKYLPGFNYSYLIQPQSSSSPVILFLNQLAFPDCGDRLEVYDGKTSDLTKLLGIFCSTTAPYKWITATSGQMLIRFVANSDQSRNSTFDLAYYSDGPNYHCGFTTNPATLHSSSMFITDGSQSSEPIYSNQYCEWIIAPAVAGQGVILYFERLDLRGGGVLTIYDGTSTDAATLIQINGASVVPVPISSTLSPNVRVVFSTSAALGVGTGFSLSYFSINSLHTGPGDDVIKIYASSCSALSLPLSLHTHQALSSNYTWYINPLASTQPLYLILSTLNLTNCDESIIVSEGSPLNKGAVISKVLCGDNKTLWDGSWIKLSGGEVVVEFVTKKGFPSSSPPLLTSTPSNFHLAYFTKDGESFQCGISKNPLRLSLSSYFISDGTSATDTMHLGDLCEWIIEIPGEALIVFEMLSLDLTGGGKLWIFDGPDDTSSSELLWSCLECSYNPPLLFSSTSALFIRYQSPLTQSNQLGFGFQGLYWSLDTEPIGGSNVSSSDSILLLPTGLSFSPVVPFHFNETFGWNLLVTEHSSTLTHYPFYQLTPSTPSGVTDGRDPNTMEELYRGVNRQYSCGVLGGNQATILSSSTTLSSSQSSARYISYNMTQRTVSGLGGSWTKQSEDDGGVAPAETCVYLLDSGPVTRSITLNIDQFVSPSTGHLRVYGGVTGNDRLLVDLSMTRTKGLKLLLPCGKGLIIIDSNSSSASPLLVDYGFRISYALNDDYGKACKKYSEWTLFSSLLVALLPHAPSFQFGLSKKIQRKRTSSRSC
jgi:hypothetical protein